MKTISHPEFETRMAWIEEEWNRPDRHDYYIMRLIYAVENVLNKKPRSVQLGRYKIPFTFDRKLGGGSLEGAKRLKAACIGAFGGGADHTKNRSRLRPRHPKRGH